MQNQKSGQAGFSLIEVLVAISIFIFGLLAIANLQISSIIQSSGSNTRTVATSIANGIMEEITSRSELDPSFRTTAGGDWLFAEGTSTDLALDGAGGYTATWSITTNTPVPNLARISVTVSGPRTRTITMTSFKRFQ